ncbi:hypothetical protein [Aquamicrobium sp. LC103]|uniref:hypothetical protein n=1 Tax=Aquamicrobium sp. LC103 TaxID=1120658 RepID=UPI00063ECD7F|nr:hypothetical protein [Aquamicrobium sp. LC103]TKT75230.1 hypothetical protein XW59_019010 [Aquamicrobium sp. LC103]
MSFRSDWDRQTGGWRLGGAGMSVLRVTLLFGSAAVALALILTPLAESQARRVAQTGTPVGVDMMSTGSIGQRGSSYTVRRSVLQPTPNSICIIRDDGTRSGDC